MEDYSFMKSGRGLNQPVNQFSEIDQQNIQILLSLFLSNGMINAAKYSNYCGRNGVTQQDMLYGLRYEIFEFTNRTDLDKGIAEIKEEYESYLEDPEAEDDTEQMIDEMTMDDDKIESYSRILNDKVTDENREFVDKMHNYYDNWDCWQPATPLEQILKRGIDKINDMV